MARSAARTRRRLRQAQAAAQAQQRVHDRRATNLPTPNPNLCIVDVDDPYQQGEKISVIINLRDDLLARWKAQGLIDAAQHAAGRRWQQLWQQAQIGAVKSVDLERTPVDNWCAPDATPQQLRAMGLIAKAAAALGREGDSLIRHVLGFEMSVAQAALIRGLDSAREQGYVARRLRECLETLAREFSLA